MRQILNECQISIDAGINCYDHEDFNRLVSSGKVAIDDNNNGDMLRLNHSLWKIENHLHDNIDELYTDVKVKFTLEAGILNDAGLFVSLNIDRWSVNNYVMMPGAVYNGNRFESRKIPYSPKLTGKDDIGPYVPQIISDVPRLNNKSGSSCIQERSGGPSAPACCFFHMQKQYSILIFTYQSTKLGDTGITIEENKNRDKAVIKISAPVIREKTKYKICDNAVPSDDIPVNFSEGDTCTIDLRIYCYKTKEITDLFSYYFKTRRTLYGHQRNKLILPLSSCFPIQEKKFNIRNYVPEHGYYSVGMRDGKYRFLQDWQIGWTGGMISTYPLYFNGTNHTRLNVMKNFEWLFRKGISPSGFFWDAGEEGTKWYGGDIRREHTKNWHLIRKSGDALYYIIKQLILFTETGEQVKEEWKTKTKAVADKFVYLWKKWGQLGQFVDSATGNIIVGGSTSGAIVPAALVLSTEYFGDKKYLHIAEQIAHYYYDNFITKGITCGGPGDALQNCDSESSYAMLESFMKLFEHTGKDEWLVCAEKMACQFSSWVMPYNYKFPKGSTLGKLNITTVGSVTANTQNKHGAPGICTHSGLALLRLFRATLNKRYAELLQDICQHINQNLSHPENPVPGMPYGWMSERVSTNDWFEGIGELMYGSTWAETSLMLTYTEIPGLYVIPDKSVFFAFDHVYASMVEDNKKEVILTIENPTKVDAHVRTLVEYADELQNPYGENKLLNCNKITIKAGNMKEVLLNKNKETKV